MGNSRITDGESLADSYPQQNLNYSNEAGYQAFTRKDYATALKIFSQLAGQGNAEAQHNLGVMYERGHGVAQDYRQAVSWYQKAANQVYANAQNNLGWMYEQGQGVAQDYRQARYWWEKAANQTADANARQAAQQGLQQLNQMGK